MSQRLGRFEIVRKIAQGGMAEVFLGVRRDAGGAERSVAIKQMVPDSSNAHGLMEMFLDEARIAAELTHPNLCQLVDFGAEDGRCYLAMEYLEGQTLDRVFERALKEGRPLSPDLAAFIVAQAAEGLAHAHERKDAEGRPLELVHRDVSPSNVFITYDGQVKVLGAGIARTRQRLTSTRTADRGRQRYFSPEQVAAHPIDAGTDVFALGIMLHELLSGRILFEAEDEPTVLRKIIDGPIPPLSGGAVPEELARVAEAALERDRGRRLASAREMAELLHAALRQRAQPPDAQALATLMQSLFADERVSRPPPKQRAQVLLFNAEPRGRLADDGWMGEERKRHLWTWALVAALLGALLLGRFLLVGR